MIDEASHQGKNEREKLLNPCNHLYMNINIYLYINYAETKQNMLNRG